MEISKDDAQNMIAQVQAAHRISVAFYRRILPTLDDIANQLGCGFEFWDTLHTDPVGRKTTQPSKKWAWDFVPLFASRHVYWRTNGKTAHPDDVSISFYLYVDDALVPENRRVHGVKGQPDAVKLPIGRAVLQAWAYRPIKASKKSFSELWWQADDCGLGEKKMREVSPGLNGIGFEWPLADVIQDTQLRIPVNPATHSALNRPPIPVQTGHPVARL